MFMIDFMTCRYTLECLNQLGIIGTSLRNSYEKIRENMRSPCDLSALRGAER